MWPTLKLKHSFVRPALVQFGQLYLSSLGGKGDLIFNHLSLSLRVVIFHYRRCAYKPGVWDICQRAYKGKGDLNIVSDIFTKMEECAEDEDDDEERDAEGDLRAPESLALVPLSSEPHVPTTNWLELSQQAPIPELWQVRLHMNWGVSSIFANIQNTAGHISWRLYIKSCMGLCSFGAVLVHFWYTFGAFLVHFWCIFGALLVHFWCTCGNSYKGVFGQATPDSNAVEVVCGGTNMSFTFEGGIATTQDKLQRLICSVLPIFEPYLLSDGLHLHENSQNISQTLLPR